MSVSLWLWLTVTRLGLFFFKCQCHCNLDFPWLWFLAWLYQISWQAVSLLLWLTVAVTATSVNWTVAYFLSLSVSLGWWLTVIVTVTIRVTVTDFVIVNVTMTVTDCDHTLCCDWLKSWLISPDVVQYSDPCSNVCPSQSRYSCQPKVQVSLWNALNMTIYAVFLDSGVFDDVTWKPAIGAMKKKAHRSTARTDAVSQKSWFSSELVIRQLCSEGISAGSLVFLNAIPLSVIPSFTVNASSS